MRKDEFIEQMRKMLFEMQPRIEDAKPRPIVLPTEIDLLSHEILRKGHSWIRKIYQSNEYEMVKKARKLLPEEQWRRYALWEDFDDHQEVKIYNAAIENFRKVLNHGRPELFRVSTIARIIKREKKRQGDYETTE